MSTTSSSIVALACALVSFVPLGAQEAGFGTELLKHEAWSIRLDASAPRSSIEVRPVGQDVNVQTETAALVWRPRDRGRGDFVVRATVRIPPGVVGGAGLFFGGYDMEGMDRNWAACLVRRDGSWSIPHRNGVEFHDFSPWATHEALKPADPEESSADVV